MKKKEETKQVRTTTSPGDVNGSGWRSDPNRETRVSRTGVLYVVVLHNSLSVVFLRDSEDTHVVRSKRRQKSRLEEPAGPVLNERVVGVNVYSFTFESLYKLPKGSWCTGPTPTSTVRGTE